MKKLIAAFIVGAFLSAGVIGCGPGTTSGPTGTSSSGAPGPVTGKVTKVENGKITVDAKDYTIPDTAKVMIDGAKKTPADIKTGDTATITMDKDSKVTDVDVKTK